MHKLCTVYGILSTIVFQGKCCEKQQTHPETEFQAALHIIINKSGKSLKKKKKRHDLICRIHHPETVSTEHSYIIKCPNKAVKTSSPTKQTVKVNSLKLEVVDRQDMGRPGYRTRGPSQQSGGFKDCNVYSVAGPFSVLWEWYLGHHSFLLSFSLTSTDF